MSIKQFRPIFFKRAFLLKAVPWIFWFCLILIGTMVGLADPPSQPPPPLGGNGS